MIGQLLSHYRILSGLGSGGMGVVYEAEDVRLGRRVAVKVLPAGAGRDAEAMERFTREARIVSTLNHPHICVLFDVGEHDGGQFMVMEKLEGELLRTRIAGGPLPVEEILELAVHAASALGAAHERGVIHRDVKPANLFVTPHGLKVLDFGVAKLAQAGGRDRDGTHAATDELTRAGTALGTVAYMSPEQARGQEIDARSDLFSLGCVVYEMATGTPPFTGATTAVVFEGLLTQTPPPPSSIRPGLPAALDRIVLRALEKQPAARYGSAGAMQADLQRLLREVQTGQVAPAAPPAAAGDVGPSPAPSRLLATPSFGTPATGPAAPDRRRAGRRALVIGAPLALAAGVAGFVLLQSDDTPALTERDPVVLAQFMNRTGDAMFDDTLSEALGVQLRQSPFLNVLAEQQVQATLRLMGRDPATLITPEIGRELCQRAGAKAVLGGTIASLGTSYVITLNAENCITGDSLAEQQVQAARKEEVLKALGSAVAPFRAQLGESLASVQRYDTHIEEATTRSLDALRAYSQGVQARRKEGDRAALPFFRRAIELDPDFALAHVRLGTIYSNIHSGESEAHTRRAYALRQSVSERERLYIEARYHSTVTRDVDKAIESYRLAVAAFPTDYASRVNLAGLLKAQGRADEAVPMLEDARRIAPGEPLAAVNLAGALLDLRRTDEALEAAREAVRLRDDAGARNVLLAAAVQAGAADVEREQRAWAEGRPADPDAVIMLANHDAYHGRLGRSTAQWIRLSALAGERGLQDLATQARLAAGIYLAQAGDRKGARAVVAPLGPPAAELSDNARSAWLSYAWLAGDRTPARALAQRPVSPPPGEGSRAESLESRAGRSAGLAAEGKVEEALALLGEVPLSRGSGTAVYLVASLQLETGRSAEAIRALEWARDNAGGTDLSPNHAAVRYLLARAYHDAKRPGDARRAYRAFLDFWSDADEGLPIVEDAKKRLAQLGT